MTAGKRVNLSIYYRELVESIRAIGLAATAMHVVGTIRDHVFDWQSGTDTSSWVALKDLQIESESAVRGVDYHPTRARPFRKLLSRLDLSRDRAFVDFGCGKGRAVLLAMEYGFRKVTGIEFSASLSETARRNVEIFGARINAESIVEIVHGDVIDYTIADDETVFYFFNPFDEVIFGKVLSNIQASLASAPREISLIYYNPVQHQTIEDKAPFLGLAQKYDIAGCVFNVYRGKLDLQQ